MYNILFITADDMSYNSCLELLPFSPNLNELGEKGFCFHNAHTTISLCQPSRAVMMTGLYPWNNGARGFESVDKHIETLPEILKKHDYKLGILGKVHHYKPESKFQWDYLKLARELGQGRSPQLYYRYCIEFLNSVDGNFLLLANSHDPHRQFPKDVIISPENVIVPSFLNDTFDTRLELSQYYTAVNRCDETVGCILSALNDSGKADKTVVIFTSDHGMAFPFVKANCYHFSTRVPLIYRIPGLNYGESFEHVSSVDIMPTLLDILGLSHVTDGNSYLQLLQGKAFKSPEFIYTCLEKGYHGNSLNTRAIHNQNICYIRNFWSNGKDIFSEDGSLDHQSSFSSLSSTRRTFLRYRSPVEFYDIQVDPYAQNNIAEYNKDEVAIANFKMMEIAIKTNDELAIEVLKRENLKML